MKAVLRRLLLSWVLLGAATAQAESVATGCDRLVATGNPDYPPYLWRSQQQANALVGANQLLLEEVGKRLGVSIEVVYSGSWSRAQEEVRAGRVDLIAGAFLTSQRLDYMDYIHPAFYTTRSMVWARRDQSLNYQDWADLKQWQGISLISNSFGQQFDSYARDQLNIDSVATLDQAMRMLVQGRVDYLLYEEFPAAAYAERLGFSAQLRSLEPPVSQEQLFLTLSHRSSCNTGALRGQLTRILTEVVEDGTAQRLLSAGLADWQRQHSPAD